MAGDYLKVTEEKIYGQVVAGPLNVRSGPSADAEKVDSLSVGTIVEIEELIGGSWRLVPDRGRLCQQRLCGPGGCGGGLCFRQGQ